MKNIFFLIFFTLSLTINLLAAPGKTYTLTVDSPTVVESIGTFDLNVRVEPKLGPGDVINFTYSTQDGTATGGSDYTIISGATKQITNGDNVGASTIATIPVTILNDGLSGEGNEGFNIIITAASINDAANTVVPNNTGGLITITDDDLATLPTLSINDKTVNEDAGTTTFTASISPTSVDDVIFSYATVDGTATGGLDYTIKSEANMLIAAGSSSVNITIPIINDIEAGEGSETFTVFMNNANNAIIGDNQGIGTIIDDDTGLTASINDASIAEGDVDKTVIVKVRFSQPISADMNFTYTTTAGSATDGLDYTGVNSGTANVPAGATEHNLTLTILGDTLSETPEDFTITISNFTDATLVIAKDEGTVTIFDNDTTSACSSYIGLMTINEYQNNPHYFDLNHKKVVGNYVEIKYIDFLVKQFVTDEWKVQIYTTAGDQGILWRDRDEECIDPRYEVFQFDNNVMGAKGYVVLTDENGNEVDVLNIDNSNHYAQSCTNFPYDTDFDSSAQNKDLFRIPDGTGTWYDTGQGANSVGSRCQGYGDGGGGVTFTQFEAIDVLDKYDNAAQPLPIPGFTGASIETPIKTKVVNNEFGLRILWLNLSATPVVLKNSGTVDINVSLGYIDDDNNVQKLPDGVTTPNTPKTITFNNNGEELVTFKYDRAHPKVHILFEYCVDDNQTLYSIQDCQIDPTLHIVDPIPVSRNAFAIRPDKFEVGLSHADYPNLMRAGQYYGTSLKALEANTTTNASDYTIIDHNFHDDLGTESTKYFRDGVEDIGGLLLHGSSDVNTSDYAYMINGLSSTTSTQPLSEEETIKISYSDVGNVNIQIYDENWAAIDNDDTFPDCNYTSHTRICGDLNVTFIPHHFGFKELNISNHAGPDSNFTYVAERRGMPVNIPSPIRSLMAARVHAKIEALTQDGNITQNFRKDFGGNLYYENNISVSQTVVIPTVRILPLDPNAYIYGAEANKSKIDNKLVGFGRTTGLETDDPGTRNIKWDEDTYPLEFNFQRDYDKPASPFDVNGSYYSISITSVYTDASTPSSPQTIAGQRIGDRNISTCIAPPTGTCVQQNAENNATFYYGKAQPSQDPYSDVMTNSVNTPILVKVYCNPLELVAAPVCTDYGIAITSQTNEYTWWLSPQHRMDQGHGNVELVVGTIDPVAAAATVTTAQSVTINANPNAEDPNVEVNATSAHRPMSVNIDFVTNDAVADYTHPWLIYNQYTNSVPSPFYKVIFTGADDWAGHGTTGWVVGDDASTKKNKRLGW